MEKKPTFFEKFWYLFIILAIILICFIAALWFLNQKELKEQKVTQQKENSIIIQPTATPIMATPTPIISDEQTLKLENQGGSDEVEEIEKDLKATDLVNLDKEITPIEQELNKR